MDLRLKFMTLFMIVTQSYRSLVRDRICHEVTLKKNSYYIKEIFEFS